MSRGIVVLATAAAAAAVAPLPVQLTFAIVGLGGVGMVHGAGDLAVVAPAWRRTFVIVYGVVSLATLLWWTADPAMALPAFLVASAIHFGIENAPKGGIGERFAHGAGLIAAPAALHSADYAALLHAAAGQASTITGYGPLLAGVGGLAGMALLLLASTRRDARLAGGACALLVLPPLIGFTVGFLLLHALPQTDMRRDRLGHTSTIAYLRAVTPIMAAAFVLGGVTILLLSRFDPSGVRGLFAGIAALAMPHLLVTPFFEQRGRETRLALAGGE